MADVNIRLNLEMSPRAFRAFLPLLFVSVLAGDLASEAVTLNTYYPAPSGVYTQMIATGNTFLARDGGCVDVGTTAACGSATTKLAVMTTAGVPLVGIGTVTPGQTLYSAARNPNYPYGGVALEVFGPGGPTVNVNGQILVGDATNHGGIFLNAAGNQFIGTTDTAVWTAYPHFPAATMTPPSPYPMAFYNGVGIISVGANGYVGIGSSSAGAPLDVNGIMSGRSWTMSFPLP